jgi:hypothetical protein
VRGRTSIVAVGFVTAVLSTSWAAADDRDPALTALRDRTKDAQIEYLVELMPFLAAQSLLRVCGMDDAAEVLSPSSEQRGIAGEKALKVWTAAGGGSTPEDTFGIARVLGASETAVEVGYRIATMRTLALLNVSQEEFCLKAMTAMQAEIQELKAGSNRNDDSAEKPR